MIFRHFLLDVNEANAFIAGCEKTREALLVDAGSFDPAIADFLDANGLKLTTVFITHAHFDHTDGLREFVSRYRPQVFAAGSRAGGLAAHGLRHGDQIKVGTLAGAVLDTRGHTPDSLSLAFPGHVFTGDALFAGSIGGTSSGAQKQQEIGNIRQHIFTLPPGTEVHTGHGPSSTVAIESRFNPFFR